MFDLGQFLTHYHQSVSLAKELAELKASLSVSSLLELLPPLPPLPLLELLLVLVVLLLASLGLTDDDFFVVLFEEARL